MMLHNLVWSAVVWRVDFMVSRFGNGVNLGNPVSKMYLITEMRECWKGTYASGRPHRYTYSYYWKTVENWDAGDNWFSCIGMIIARDLRFVVRVPYGKAVTQPRFTCHRYSIHRVQHTLCTAYTIYSIHRVQHTPWTAPSQKCISSVQSHDYKLTSEWCFSFRFASIHGWPASASLAWELNCNITMPHRHVCESSNSWIESQHRAHHPATGSTSSFNLAQSWHPMCISNLSP